MRIHLVAIVPLLLFGCAIAFAVEPNTGATTLTGQSRAKPGDEGDAVLALQVALDRAGFSPGVIDSHYGNSTEKAVSAFQEAQGHRTTGELDDATATALRIDEISSTVSVSADAASVGTVGGPLPAKPEDQAGLPSLPYASFEEALAERYHTTAKMLAALNPTVQIAPGATVVVPNVEGSAAASAFQPISTGDGNQSGDAAWQATLASLGVAPVQPTAAKLIVDKAHNDVRAFDAQGRLIAAFPATIGSSDNPSPEGELKITGVSHQPRFKYDSKVLGNKERRKQFDLAPGPNNLVGVVWLQVSKEHVGMHGTPQPELIGRAASHGCVRMTNWDAARLAQMVKPGTPVIFEGDRAKPDGT